MIITQTPVRVSFLGGGTDYPDYYMEHGGATLATTIDKYTIVTVHPITQFLDYNIRVHYSKIESVESLDEIEHPSARECLRFLGIRTGVEIHYVGDLPARSGLGSSSSATVGLLHALHAYKNEKVSRAQLADEAVYVEQTLIEERVGSQDQHVCALGGFLHLKFEPNGQIHAEPVDVSAERMNSLQDRLMLLYTNQQRTAHDVLDEQVARTAAGENDAGLAQLSGLVDRGIALLTGQGEISQFGDILHESWMVKRQLSSKITTDRIDNLYQRALDAGATGGKLLGAGGGGFLLLFVEPENRSCVRNALTELPEAKFQFDSSGSVILFRRS